MVWWKKALVNSLCWMAFVLAMAGLAAWYVSSHPVSNATVEQRIDRLASLAGNVAGVGVVLIFFLAYRARAATASRSRRAW